MAIECNDGDRRPSSAPDNGGGGGGGSEVLLRVSEELTTCPNKVMPLRRQAAVRQLTMSLLANVTVLSAGMSLGFPAVSLTVLSTVLTPSQCSWFASVQAIMCPVGGLLASYVLDKYGRKVSMIAINVISVVAWTVTALADNNSIDLMYGQLIVARVLLGVCPRGSV